MDKETQKLGTLSIGKLLFSQATPAVIGMLVMALYNFVDAIFIGQFVSEEAIAATSIVFPIQIGIGAFAMAFGVGAASIISRKLGEKKLEEVGEVFGTFQVFSFSFVFLLSVIALFFIPQLLHFFGSTPEILDLVEAYLVPLLIGSVFLAFSMGNNAILRSAGHPQVSMQVMLISAVSNLLLDVIFMKFFHRGIAGAARATVLSWCVSTLMIIWHYKYKLKTIPIQISYFHFHFQHIKNIVLIGFPTLLRQIIGSISIVVVNNFLKVYGGTDALTVYGIMNKILQLFMMPMFGIVQGMQPIIGYNYGARLHHRVKEVVLLGIKLLTFFCSLIALIYWVDPTFLVRFFSPDLLLIDRTGVVMRTVVFAFPLIGFQIIASAMYQALGFVKKAFILTLMRQLFLFLPVLFLMIWLWDDKLQAIWLTFPISDILGSVVTVFFFLPDFKKLTK